MSETKRAAFTDEYKHDEFGAQGSHEMSHKKSNKAGVRNIMVGDPDEQEKHGADRASHEGKPE